jgi:hypothetical protein
MPTKPAEDFPKGRNKKTGQKAAKTFATQED